MAQEEQAQHAQARDVRQHEQHAGEEQDAQLAQAHGVQQLDRHAGEEQGAEHYQVRVHAFMQAWRRYHVDALAVGEHYSVRVHAVRHRLEERYH
eukprot:12737694-Alexandrium_andersonii.AAC.1